MKTKVPLPGEVWKRRTVGSMLPIKIVFLENRDWAHTHSSALCSGSLRSRDALLAYWELSNEN